MSKELKPRRAMRREEIDAAIKLSGCRFLPFTASKRFARQMGAEARRETSTITEGQSVYLRELCERMRRQLPRNVVEWATMNMSFFHTTRQIRERLKDVTRRLGWENLKPGERFQAIVKGQGLKKGERVEVLAQCECISNRRELLKEITQDDVVREGFPEMTPADFIGMFCKHMRCTPEQPVQRIEFKYID